MKTLRNILAAAAVTLAAGPALAAVNGTHHDLTTVVAGATEVCLYCHGVLDLTTDTGQYGDVGELCLSRCHNTAIGYAQTTGALPNRPATIDDTGTLVPPVGTVTAVNVLVASGGAHGLSKAALLDPVLGATPVPFAAEGTALPYGGNADIECTTCHNVHDNTNTPFLQADLFTGGPAGRPSFCEACHTARGNSWAGGETAPNGEHPTNFALVLGDVTIRDSVTNGRQGRYIGLDGNIFDTASPNGAALNDPGTSYVTGGKVGGFVNATGAATDTFGCYTCHSAHADLNLGASTPSLILRNAVNASGEWNPICVGCHGEEATGLDDPNPSLAANNYYHPVGSGAAVGTAAGNIYTYTTSTGNFTFAVDLTAIGVAGGYPGVGGISEATLGIEAATGKPRCGSCHDVHGGVAGTMALIDLEGGRDGAMAGKLCDSCHTGIGLVDVADDSGQAGEGANAHHRTRTSAWDGATVTDADGNILNLDGANAASWLTAVDHTNGLGCADCHVFDGTAHSTAHNW